MLLEEKKQFINEFKENLKESQSCILTNYQGLAVNDITELRSKLRRADSSMKVVKNRLVKRALNDIKDERYEKFDSYLKGPTAVLLAGKDPTAAIKIFKEFSDKNEFMKFKAGMINDNTVTREQLLRLGDLPSKEVMLGKTVNVINAPLQGLYSALSGIIKNLAYALGALKDKIEEEGPAEEKKQEASEKKEEEIADKKEYSGKKEETKAKKPEPEEESKVGKNSKEKEKPEKSEEKNKDKSKKKQEGDDGKEEK